VIYEDVSLEEMKINVNTATVDFSGTKNRPLFLICLVRDSFKCRNLGFVWKNFKIKTLGIYRTCKLSSALHSDALFCINKFI
jgi:hypothetical protein